MKTLMLGTAMAMIFGATASAQDLFRTAMDPVAITASDFIGKRVYAAEAVLDADEYAGLQDGWNDIGEINDIVLTRDGRVDAVLVDIGGFLGLGERQVALGMENIRFVADSATAEDLSDFFLVINANRGVLEGAPAFGGMTMTDGTETATTDGAMASDGMRMIDGFASVDTSAVTAEELGGVRVYGPSDEDLGEISEVVPNDTGMAAQVIVDVGGFLGIGEKPVAIDVTTIQFMRETDGNELRAYVRLTQEELESLPAVAK